ncbi:MAG: hypothetical protein MUE44_15990 [Oscillatoriaceae cyanobacterium Prado104]|nr:hypothetical protein [Oscillatoriaceae cyanobacterium Prado104]
MVIKKPLAIRSKKHEILPLKYLPNAFSIAAFFQSGKTYAADTGLFAKILR